jgi:hypothetical protein
MSPHPAAALVIGGGLLGWAGLRQGAAAKPPLPHTTLTQLRQNTARTHAKQSDSVAKIDLPANPFTGELAWGDTWFGGATRSPWDPGSGSCGSSAGPAAAVVAGEGLDWQRV